MKILLDEIMNKRELSVRQVSMMTGLGKSTIQKIRNGKSSPTMDTMEKLAVGLKTTIESLYEYDSK